MESKADQFSYKEPEQSRLTRALLNTIETMTGRRKLHKLYHRLDPDLSINVWEQIIQVLDVKLDFNPPGLDAIPEHGPLVVVANHPFGVLDGVIVNYLVSKRRQRFKILTNNALCAIPGVAEYFLPVSFAETREALTLNIQTRKTALDMLQSGEAIIIFPAGAVSTSRKLFGPAVDSEWKSFTSRLIQKSRATVVPIYFQGQNSRVFQIASHISNRLRLSLLLGEMHNKIGQSIRFHIGQPMSAESLSMYHSRDQLIQYLQTYTYSLSGMITRQIQPQGELSHPNPY
ncbi:MAG: lysophospholipid acyltransferase family protein [Leptospiraceae bacterium]|nr:lysophospholipid acyltransferase family protein [Leptospiraceae bacterium]